MKRHGPTRPATARSSATRTDHALKIGDRIYLCTPHNILLALDARNGKELWRYGTKVPDNTVPRGRMSILISSAPFRVADKARFGPSRYRSRVAEQIPPSSVSALD
ncbi:PQQ-binding-like beta-propeller repeat protein [Rhodanobacter fulvus]|uniref:PQQ-binding-like beta-propeller repeat protein n=1 Tax=Rhodanobacter fulvus TaxID=219571 RepID=UPI000A046096